MIGYQRRCLPRKFTRGFHFVLNLPLTARPTKANRLIFGFTYVDNRSFVLCNLKFPHALPAESRDVVLEPKTTF